VDMIGQRDAPGPLLVIGAHAFDAEVMAGGLVAVRSHLGATTVVLHVSLGEAGHVGKTTSDYAAQKRDEALRAAAVLGAQAKFLDHPDTRVSYAPGLAKQIAQVVQEVRPQTVVTHWRGSWHPDHVATHHATIKGLILAGLAKGAEGRGPYAPSELLFAENWEDGEDFRPQAYRDISEGFEPWQAALAEYEIGRPDGSGFPYRDYYTALARLRGCLFGVRYAEAFLPAPVEVLAGLGMASPGRPQTGAGPHISAP
jgi:N-acetylglucosamine malate deacetylase 1